MKRFKLRLELLLERFNFLAPLLTRILIGWVFFESGWGKLHNLSGVTEYFQTLGIPFASVQAPFVSSVEFVGGLLLILGLLTRAAALPLMGTMVVAILTAKRADISSFGDFAGLSETTLFLGLLWLFFYGAGSISIDHFLFRAKSHSLSE